jgi:hypothetical protein
MLRRGVESVNDKAAFWGHLTVRRKCGIICRNCFRRSRKLTMAGEGRTIGGRCIPPHALTYGFAAMFILSIFRRRCGPAGRRLGIAQPLSLRPVVGFPPPRPSAIGSLNGRV